jgi:hypothetical protein
MTTKVICDRCGEDVEKSDTQLIIKIARIVGKDLLLFKEKDYCKSCYETVMLTIESILDKKLDD